MSDEPPHVRALTVHDQAKRTARLRTELELPTFEEFVRMCEAGHAPAAGTMMAGMITETKSAEQQARDMLERMGVEDAQSMSAGDLVELANLIATQVFTHRDVEQLRSMCKLGGCSGPAVCFTCRIAGGIERMLPPH